MQEQLVYRTPTRAEVEAIMNEAYTLRSAAFADGFVYLGRAIANGVQASFRVAAEIVQAIDEARIARQTYEDLSRLNDRELADMGLTRSDIPAVVAGTFQRQDQQTVAEQAAETAEPVVEFAEPEFRKAA